MKPKGASEPPAMPRILRPAVTRRTSPINLGRKLIQTSPHEYREALFGGSRMGSGGAKDAGCGFAVIGDSDPAFMVSVLGAEIRPVGMTGRIWISELNAAKDANVNIDKVQEPSGLLQSGARRLESFR